MKTKRRLAALALAASPSRDDGRASVKSHAVGEWSAVPRKRLSDYGWTTTEECIHASRFPRLAVIPAKAGIQRLSTKDTGPRLRGDDKRNVERSRIKQLLL